MENTIKKINIIFAIALLIVIIITLCIDTTKSTETIDASEKEISNKIKILIDPGHGGVDQGASGNLKKPEAPINLEISQKLMKFLEASGFEVSMTRYEDKGLYTENSTTIRAKKNEDLANRVKAINNSEADLAISIHLNSFTQKQYYGAHVFYQKKFDTTKVAADVLQDNMKKILDNSNNRVAQIKKDIKIMDDTNIPTILIECGFLSNIEEEKKLISEEYQEKIAWAIYAGLIQYFNQL